MSIRYVVMHNRKKRWNSWEVVQAVETKPGVLKRLVALSTHDTEQEAKTELRRLMDVAATARRLREIRAL